jgi:NAD(P)-dependent dehydrogenase (short-subunit alcohol dehydrogenase family)
VRGPAPRRCRCVAPEAKLAGQAQQACPDAQPARLSAGSSARCPAPALQALPPACTAASTSTSTSTSPTTPAKFRAGIAYKGDTFGADEAQATLATNFQGTAAVCEALAPLMPQGGRVVNVCSM